MANRNVIIYGIPIFTIDNEKITNRRVIANEFNKYFVSLAFNLNEAYRKLKEIQIKLNQLCIDLVEINR